jgi:hypothetical protein
MRQNFTHRFIHRIPSIGSFAHRLGTISCVLVLLGHPTTADTSDASDAAASVKAAADATEAMSGADAMNKVETQFRFLLCIPSGESGVDHFVAVRSKSYEQSFVVGDVGGSKPTTAFSDEGRFSILNDRYAFISADQAEVGSCQDVTHSVENVLAKVAGAFAPEFEAYLGSKVTSPDVVAVANMQLMIAQEDLRAARDKIRVLQNKLCLLEPPSKDDDCPVK